MTLLQTEYLTTKGTFNGKKPVPEHVQNSLIEHTKFLNYNAPNVTRVGYILAGYQSQLKCQECGILLQITSSLTRASLFCSLKCSNANVLTKEKRAKTNITKYGVANPFSDVEKIKSAMIKKYGVDNPAKLDAVKQIISKKNIDNAAGRVQLAKITNIQKYGTEWACQSLEVLNKKQKTNLKKYGTSESFSSKEIQEKAKATKLSRYGTENTAALETVKQKIKQTKLDRYNNQTFNNRKKANITMQDRYGNHSSKKHWDNHTSAIMENKELLDEFINGKTINYAADQLNVASTTLRNKIYNYGIISYEQRKNQYEDLVRNLLNRLLIDYTEHDRSVLDGKEIDFFIPSLSLGIECNGMFWHSELMGKDRMYHLEKTLMCETKKVRLLQFWDYQFDSQWPIIESIITNAVKKTPIRIGARSTKICEISAKECADFLTHNHMQGNTRSSVRIGLRYQNELVSVMCFGKSRFSSNEFELIRFANKLNTVVPGAASRLFNYFLNKHTAIKTIISYADRDISNGHLYAMLGFNKISYTAPGYFYFQGRSVFNRMQFQKHKLQKILKNFDPALSEWQNMQNNGYNRFWTTGNIKYEFTRS